MSSRDELRWEECLALIKVLREAGFTGSFKVYLEDGQVMPRTQQILVRLTDPIVRWWKREEAMSHAQDEARG